MKFIEILLQVKLTSIPHGRTCRHFDYFYISAERWTKLFVSKLIGRERINLVEKVTL